MNIKELQKNGFSKILRDYANAFKIEISLRRTIIEGIRELSKKDFNYDDVLNFEKTDLGQIIEKMKFEFDFDFFEFIKFTSSTRQLLKEP